MLPCCVSCALYFLQVFDVRGSTVRPLLTLPMSGAGGAPTCLAFHPQLPSLLFVGASRGGLTMIDTSLGSAVGTWQVRAVWACQALIAAYTRACKARGFVHFTRSAVGTWQVWGSYACKMTLHCTERSRHTRSAVGTWQVRPDVLVSKGRAITCRYAGKRTHYCTERSRHVAVPPVMLFTASHSHIQRCSVHTKMPDPPRLHGAL